MKHPVREVEDLLGVEQVHWGLHNVTVPDDPTAYRVMTVCLKIFSDVNLLQAGDTIERITCLTCLKHSFECFPGLDQAQHGAVTRQIRILSSAGVYDE